MIATRGFIGTGFSDVFMSSDELMSGELKVSKHILNYKCGRATSMRELKQDYWEMLHKWEGRFIKLILALSNKLSEMIYRALVCRYVTIKQPKPKSRLKAKLYK